MTKVKIAQGFAGCGKTHYVGECLADFQKGIALSFTHHAVNSLKRVNSNPEIDVRTIHSFGHRCLRLLYNGIQTDPQTSAQNQTVFACREIGLGTPSYGIQNAIYNAWALVLAQYDLHLEKEEAYVCFRLALESLEKFFGFQQKSPRMLFEAMIEAKGHLNRKGEFSFADMLYALYEGCQNEEVFLSNLILDEAQLFPAIFWKSLRLLIDQGNLGTILAAGDEHQSIFGWTGATGNWKEIMNYLGEADDMRYDELVVSYRCRNFTSYINNEFGLKLVGGKDQAKPVSVGFDKMLEMASLGMTVVTFRRIEAMEMASFLLDRELSVETTASVYNLIESNHIPDDETMDLEKLAAFRQELRGKLILSEGERTADVFVGTTSSLIGSEDSIVCFVETDKPEKWSLEDWSKHRYIALTRAKNTLMILKRPSICA